MLIMASFKKSLIVEQFQGNYLKTLSLNSKGMLRGTDNFYFILITFPFKLELAVINRVIEIFSIEVPI